MKKIPLTQGKFAIVDDEDYEGLSKHKWCAFKGGKTFYAVRSVLLRGRQRLSSMHREILKTPKGMHTDHINSDGLINTQNNLRVCTPTENKMNTLKQKNNKSGYKGVSWSKPSKKWQAKITVNGKRIYIGSFFCILKAARAYNDVAKKHYGEFAKLNKLN